MENTIVLTTDQASFVNNYVEYGYQSSAELVNAALISFQEAIERRRTLLLSATLYAEVYEEEEELREWTEAAI